MEARIDEINYGSQMTDKFTIYNKNTVSRSHSKSNTKKNTDLQDVLLWVRTFDLPHCHSVRSVHQLRDGIAFAQILSTIIRNIQLKSSMLSQIVISNVNAQTSKRNFKTILKTVKLLGLKKAQSYDHQEMFAQKSGQKFEEFLQDFYQFCTNTYKHSNQTKTSTKESTAFHSCENHQYYPPGLQQLSQIANLSSGNIYLSQTKQPRNQRKVVKQMPQSNIFQEIQNQGLQQQGVLREQVEKMLSPSMIATLSEWAMSQIRTNQEIEEPHQFLALLINSLFSDRLQPQPIIKKTHFQMGSLTVWKKINSYLATVQRLQKKNLIQLIKSVQQQGIVKQKVFWELIKDLKQMKKGKQSLRSQMLNQQLNQNYQNNENKQNAQKQNRSVKSMGKISKSGGHLTTERTQKGQQNMIINKRPAKQSKPKLPQVPQKNIIQAEKWIQQLGFIHSLNVSKKKKEQKRTLKNAIESPLLNGTLIGSILMRLQIGKPTLIKQPMNAKELQRNLQQLLRVSIGRGYACVRDLLICKGSYSQYLGVVFKIKSIFQGEKQKLKEILHSEYYSRKVDEIQDKSLYDPQKSGLAQWIKKNCDIQIKQKSNLFENILTCQQLSQICSQLLKLNLYRQTTLKIQLQNMEKILDELRRIGLSHYYMENAEEYVNMQEGNQKRWKIVLDLFQLFNSIF